MTEPRRIPQNIPTIRHSASTRCPLTMRLAGMQKPWSWRKSCLLWLRLRVWMRWDIWKHSPETLNRNPMRNCRRTVFWQTRPWIPCFMFLKLIRSCTGYPGMKKCADAFCGSWMCSLRKFIIRSSTDRKYFSISIIIPFWICIPTATTSRRHGWSTEAARFWMIRNWRRRCMPSPETLPHRSIRWHSMDTLWPMNVTEVSWMYTESGGYRRRPWSVS